MAEALREPPAHATAGEHGFAFDDHDFQRAG
jgi:hypothetical protein